MKTTKEKFDDSLIISRLQQIELLSLKSSPTIDSPQFHLLTIASQQPFFDNLPLNLGLEFHLLGNKILGVTVKRGFFSHDLDATIGALSPIDAIRAIARINLACPIFYQCALLSAYLKLRHHNVDAGPFNIAMEFARVGHHLRVIKNVLYCLRMPLLAEIALDCEEILKTPYQLFSRLRVPNDAELNHLSSIEASELLTDAIARAEELLESINREKAIRKQLEKKALVSMTQAGSLGLTGPFLRANQELYDLRREMTYSFPHLKPPRISVGDGKDAFTRFLLRPMEILASLRWLKQSLFEAESVIEKIEAIVIDDALFSSPAKINYAYGEVEGPEGTIKATIFSDQNHALHIRIQSPAYFIAQAIPQLLLHLDLSDVAVMLFSLGITAEEVDK